jgi:hypothetical protein
MWRVIVVVSTILKYFIFIINRLKGFIHVMKDYKLKLRNVVGLRDGTPKERDEVDNRDVCEFDG